MSLRFGAHCSIMFLVLVFIKINWDDDDLMIFFCPKGVKDGGGMVGGS